MSDRLNPGERLNPDESIRSANGRYVLYYQGDGNLVLYGPEGVYWGAGTNGPAGFAIMQGDGNFVVYSPDGPVWSSETHGENFFLVMQDDGNPVIYNAAGGAVWAVGLPGPEAIAREVEMDFGGGKHGQCTATFDTDGKIRLLTKTWTNSPYAGFHMGVQALLTKDGEVVLATSDVQRYGVDGKNVPFGAPSSRVVSYQQQLDPGLVGQVTDILIVLFHAPEWRIVEIIRQGGIAIASVVEAINDFCQRNPDLCELIRAELPRQMQQPRHYPPGTRVPRRSPYILT